MSFCEYATLKIIPIELWQDAHKVTVNLAIEWKMHHTDNFSSFICKICHPMMIKFSSLIIVYKKIFRDASKNNKIVLICLHVCVCVYLHECTCLDMLCIHMLFMLFMCLYMCLCVYVLDCLRMYMYESMCFCVWVCVYLRICMHMLVYDCLGMYVYVCFGLFVLVIICICVYVFQCVIVSICVKSTY